MVNSEALLHHQRIDALPLKAYAEPEAAYPGATRHGRRSDLTL